MSDELHHPLVTDVVEEALDVGIEYPVHALLLQPRIERIERLVRVASRPEPIREAPEVRLINLIEHGHHGLLNNLVLQRRDAQRSLPSVSLRNVHSTRGLCPVRATMYAAVQIDEPIFQPRLILAPCHAVHPGSRILLQCFETLPQQIYRHMMQQSSEPLLLPFPRHSAHAAQSLGHPFPALCRLVLDCASFSLGCRLPSTASAEGFPSLFGCFTGTTRQSDSSSCVRVRLAALRLRGPVCLIRQTRWRSPGSRACCFSTCQGLRPRRVPPRLAILSPAADVAFPLSKQGRHAVRQFSGLNSPAHRCLCLRFAVRLATHHARLEVRIESLLLFRRALSSPTTCRFIPAHSHPCVALSSYQASPVYGSFSNQKSKNHPFWKKTALNPGGLGGRAPHHGDDLFLIDRCGNRSAGVR